MSTGDTLPDDSAPSEAAADDLLHPELYVGPDQIRSRFEQPDATFATLSRWCRALLLFLDPDEYTLHTLNISVRGRVTARWMAEVIRPGGVWRRLGAALSHLYDFAQWHQNRLGGSPVPPLPAETVSPVEAARFVCDLRRRFDQWATTPAAGGNEQPISLELDEEQRANEGGEDTEESRSEAPKDWATMGEAKQAVLTVLKSATERMNGPAIAGKAGYTDGSLRHHYGALQRWGYIDRAKGGYAITPVGSAVTPCESV